MCDIKWIVVFALLAVFNCCDAQEGSSCETPLQTPGVCINIKSCDTLINLLRTQSNNVEVRNYLRRSACGFIGTTPMVCCPEGERARSTTTERQEEPLSSSPPPTVVGNVTGELLKPPNCGFSKITTARVVGGVPAKLGEFPWIVALGYKNSKDPDRPKWLCGGTLISEKHILTAGHCVHNRDDLYIARLGDLDLYSEDDGAHPVMVPIVATKLHEDYNPTSHTSDIAILTLQFKPESPQVAPICLPVDEPLRSNKFVKYQTFVAGWGALYFRGPTSSTLQVTMLPVVQNDQCRQALSNFRTIIDDRVLCAGYAQGGKDACQGDSGGPLMYGKSESRNTRFYLVGVVSYGFRCAEAGYPGVYTRVTSFIDWIRSNLN